MALKVLLKGRACLLDTHFYIIILDTAVIPEEFIPQRGRKRSGLQDFLDKDDYFQPNRGKKAGNSNVKTEKKAKTKEILDADLFFPNRGKKYSQNDESIVLPVNLIDEFFNSPYKRGKLELDLDDSFMPNRGKKGNGLSFDDEFFPNRGKKSNDFLAGEDFFPNRGKKAEPLFSNDEFFPNRGKKENSLFSENDLFFPNRGKKSLDVLTNDDFFPNRGKKAEKIFASDDFFPNRGKKADQLFSNDEFFPNRGKKATHFDTISAAKGMEKQNLKKITRDDSNMIVRRRRDLTDDLAQKKDSFYLARGRQTISNLPKSLNQV